MRELIKKVASALTGESEEIRSLRQQYLVAKPGSDEEKRAIEALLTLGVDVKAEEKLHEATIINHP